MIVTEGRIENAYLLAYMAGDMAKVAAVKKLQAHFLKARADYETSRITRDDLHATEMGVLKSIRDLFTPPNGRFR